LKKWNLLCEFTNKNFCEKSLTKGSVCDIMNEPLQGANVLSKGQRVSKMNRKESQKIFFQKKLDIVSNTWYYIRVATRCGGCEMQRLQKVT